MCPASVSLHKAARSFDRCSRCSSFLSLPCLLTSGCSIPTNMCSSQCRLHSNTSTCHCRYKLKLVVHGVWTQPQAPECAGSPTGDKSDEHATFNTSRCAFLCAYTFAFISSLLCFTQISFKHTLGPCFYGCLGERNPMA